MKPTFKAPGAERLKLQNDEPLLNCGFKFNLRRYIAVAITPTFAQAGAYTRPLISST